MDLSVVFGDRAHMWLTRTRHLVPRGMLLGMHWCLLVLLICTQMPSSVAATPSFQRGMNVYYHGNDGHNPEAISWLVSQLKAMHVDHILLDIPVYIDALNGNDIGLVFEPTATQPGQIPRPVTSWLH